MSNFFFFTDIDLLSAQTVSQRFGPVSGQESTQFRLCSLHSSTSDNRAIAVTNGQILVQQDGNADLVNLVLKPLGGTPFPFPKVVCIIYKGVKKSSLVTGSLIASSAYNDLTESIWSTQNALNSSIELISGSNPGTSPNTDTIGLNYAASASSPYAAEDSDSIDLAFFQNEGSIQLPTVDAGMHIGDFDSAEFGIEIVFEAIGHAVKFSNCRQLDHVLLVSALPGSPTQAQEFQHFHEKEEILNYIDPCAFFAAFLHVGINVTTSTSSPVKYSGNDLYDNVLSKFYSKNVTYLDIRQQQGFSYNYYKQYGTNIKLALDATSSLSTQQYYGNNWPLLIIDNSSFPTTNTSSDKNIVRIAMPEGDNTLPLMYVLSGFFKRRNFKVKRGKRRFKELTVSGGYSSEIEIMVPNRDGLSSTAIICSYTQLRYLTRIDTSNPISTNGTVMKYQDYMDGLFAAFDIDSPFKGTADIKFRQYEGEVYVDRLEDASIDYMGGVGKALESNLVTFYAFPEAFRTSPSKSIPAGIGIATGTYSGPHDFMQLMEDRNSNVEMIKSNSVISSVDHDYIRSRSSSAFVLNPFAKESLDETVFIQLTIDQYNAILSLRNDQFLASYRVFLGVTNKVSSTDDLGNPYTSFDLVLRGMEQVGTQIQAKEESTGITFHTYGNI